MGLRSFKMGSQTDHPTLEARGLSLGYHPQPGSLLGSTQRMWGWLSYRALARRLKSQASFLLVTLDFHCNVRAFSSCTMQASPVMVLRVSCPTDVGS